jgi:hypothetical protein
MTLFSKDRNSQPDANNHVFMNFGVDANLAFKVGLAPVDTSAGYSTLLTDMRTKSDRWTYVVYIMSIVDNNHTRITIEINDNNSIETEEWTNRIFVDRNDSEAYLGIESRSNETNDKVNPWNGYIYEFHIHQSEGKLYRTTTDCLEGCTACPLSLDCPWSVDWNVYYDEWEDVNGNCDTNSC